MVHVGKKPIQAGQDGLSLPPCPRGGKKTSDFRVLRRICIFSWEGDRVFREKIGMFVLSRFLVQEIAQLVGIQHCINALVPLRGRPFGPPKRPWTRCG